MSALAKKDGSCKVNHTSQGVVDDEDRPWVCDGWSNESMCRCHGPEASPEEVASMTLRADQDFFRALQQLRFLTDSKVSRKALADIWWLKKKTKKKEQPLGRVVGLLPRDLFFMEGALQRKELQAARDFSDVPVDSHSRADNGVFEGIDARNPFRDVDRYGLSTAGVRSIIVEVWDSKTFRNAFLGEAGIALKAGNHRYKPPLISNYYRGTEQKYESVEFHGAEVSVDTSATFTPKKCSDTWGGPYFDCFLVQLTVTCRGADKLPFTGGSGTRAYCKVRVKQDFTHRSSKDSTPAYKGPKGQSPEWTKGNVFKYKWEVPALPDGEPLILDRLSLRQQFQAFLAQLVRQTLLPRDDHGWCLANGEGAKEEVRKACRLLSFVELLHDTPVRRTYTPRKSSQKSEAKRRMALMGAVIEDAVGAPHSRVVDAALGEHLLRLERQQQRHFQDEGDVPEGHFIVAAMSMAVNVAP